MVRILNIDKPPGWTSFQVIRYLKRLLDEKKAGHLGTLDPLASGVLPVFLGKATKLIPFFNEGHKIYRANIRLGIRTDTYDTEGEILEKKDCRHLKSSTIEAELSSFLGKQNQKVPPFSAVKINGSRAYQLARKGKVVPVPSREVEFQELRIEMLELPNLEIQVRCSKGTYIRSLAQDLGEALKVGGCLSGLIRLECGPWFHLEQASSLESLANMDQENLPWVDPLVLLEDWFTLMVNDIQSLKVQQGQRIEVPPLSREKSLKSPMKTKTIDGQNNLVAVGMLIWDDIGCYFKPSRVLV